MAPGKNGTAASNDPAAGDGKSSKSDTTTTTTRTRVDVDGATDAEATDGSATGGDDVPNGDEVAAGRAADGRSQGVAANQRGADRTEPGRGSPLPLVFAAVAAVALLGIGVRASRRNRAAS
ncbi:MAG: hypothetical protein ABI239_06990 [Aquihabitans sp.]